MPWESEYAAIRERNRRIQRERRMHAITICPALIEWEGRYLAAQRQRGPVSAIGDFEAIALAQAKVDELLNERNDLLRQAGLPEHYLDLPFDCPICRDYGTRLGKPCACLEKWRFATRSRRSNLIGFETQTFAHFDESVFPAQDGQLERMRMLRDLCEDFANNFPQNHPKNLVFIGNVGLGKSFLLHCVGRRVLDRGFSVHKITGNQFHQMLMEDVIGRRNLAPLRELENVDLLLFDDLGCEPMVKGIVENYFFALLTERLAAGRAMITASNFSASEIVERYGERTLSRLLDQNNTRALAFKGQDLRLLRPQKTP